MDQKRAKAKSQFLSLRLDPKTRFALEFVHRAKGQSITTVVERAIKEAAGETFLPPSPDGRARNWMDFWDPSEGVRTLRLISDPSYPAEYDDDELRVFISAHKEFFFADSSVQKELPFAASGLENFHRGFVDILWPSMNEFMEIWRATKSSDPWAAGRAMAGRLKAASLDPPAWPRRKTQ